MPRFVEVFDTLNFVNLVDDCILSNGLLEHNRDYFSDSRGLVYAGNSHPNRARIKAAALHHGILSASAM